MSESKHTQTTEFEELSIGTTEGLQAFLRNAQLQYQNGLLKDEEMLRAGDYEYGNRLTQSFQKVRTVTGRLIAGLQQGHDITQRDAEALQGSYDELITTINNPITTKPTPRAVQKTETPDEVAKVSSVVTSEQDDGLQEKHTSPTAPEVVRATKNDSTPEQTAPAKPKTGQLSIGTDEAEVVDIKQNISVSDSSVQAINDGQTEKRKRRRRKKKKSKSVPSSNTSEQTAQHALERGRILLTRTHQKFPHPNLVQEMLFQELHDSVEQLELMSKKATQGEVKVSLVNELLSHVLLIVSAIDEAHEVEVEPTERGTIPIVTERASEALPVPEKDTTHQPVTFVPSSIATKRPDTTKRSIPKQLSQLPRPAEEYQQESLTELYLSAPKYKQFISEYYSSSAGFERILDSTITKIEAETIDHIDKWLGDVPASAFSFLKDMSMSEFMNFSDRSYEDVQYDLKRENIKYDTFAQWRDLASEMLSIVPRGETMKFGQLFATYMIELMMKSES